MRARSVWDKLRVESALRFLELIAPPRADEREHIVALGPHPGEGELRDSEAFLIRNSLQRFHQREIARQVLLGEARLAGADLAVCSGGGARTGR